MNQVGNLTASSGLFQMEIWGVQGEESCMGNLLLPSPPHSQSTPIPCFWAVAQLEEGRRQ